MRIKSFSRSANTRRKSGPMGFSSTFVYDTRDAPVRQYAGAAPASTEALLRARELARIRKELPTAKDKALFVANSRTATAKRGHNKSPGPCFSRPDLVLAMNG